MRWLGILFVVTGVIALAFAVATPDWRLAIAAAVDWLLAGAILYRNEPPA